MPLRFIKQPWTICLSFCIRFFRNEKEKEGLKLSGRAWKPEKEVFDLEFLMGSGNGSRKAILGKGISHYFLFNTFQSNSLKCALLKPTLKQQRTPGVAQLSHSCPGQSCLPALFVTLNPTLHLTQSTGGQSHEPLEIVLPWKSSRLKIMTALNTEFTSHPQQIVSLRIPNLQISAHCDRFYFSPSPIRKK